MNISVGPTGIEYATIGPVPVNIAEYERLAKVSMARKVHGYYASGSNDMITLRENRDAFVRVRILPRILVDVSSVNTETTILGHTVSSPICIAPTAMQRMAHDDGECATSSAAARYNSLMVLSTLSTTSLEDVAAAAPAGYRWFQLYVYKDRAVTFELVRRAARAGYKAIVVTVDTPVLGRREADIRNRFSLPDHLTIGNFQASDLALSDAMKESPSSNTTGNGSSGGSSSLMEYAASLMDSSLTWDDISWLRKNTTLKIVVKGVMTVEDARYVTVLTLFGSPITALVSSTLPLLLLRFCLTSTVL